MDVSQKYILFHPKMEDNGTKMVVNYTFCSVFTPKMEVKWNQMRIINKLTHVTGY